MMDFLFSYCTHTHTHRHITQLISLYFIPTMHSHSSLAHTQPWVKQQGQCFLFCLSWKANRVKILTKEIVTDCRVWRMHPRRYEAAGKTRQHAINNKSTATSVLPDFPRKIPEKSTAGGIQKLVLLVLSWQNLKGRVTAKDRKTTPPLYAKSPNRFSVLMHACFRSNRCTCTKCAYIKLDTSGEVADTKQLNFWFVHNLA